MKVPDMSIDSRRKHWEIDKGSPRTGKEEISSSMRNGFWRKKSSVNSSGSIIVLDNKCLLIKTKYFGKIKKSESVWLFMRLVLKLLIWGKIFNYVCWINCFLLKKTSIVLWKYTITQRKICLYIYKNQWKNTWYRFESNNEWKQSTQRYLSH